MSLFESFINQIHDRLTGPFSFRFILQPLVAIVLGIRDGHIDVKMGADPFGINFIRHPDLRSQLLKSLTIAIFKPVLFGTILDSIVQYMLFARIHPLQAVFVGTFVIAVPYIFSRGLTNRIISRNRKS